MKINIRLETPKDYYAVEEIARETFWGDNWEIEPKVPDISLLISRLRECPSYVPELHFVAEVDGKIVGHIIYSKSKIENEDGNSYETLTFGPISILPEYQNKGIGKALMLHSFDEAKRLGYRAVLIYGYPSYYPRVGFKLCSEFAITPEGSSEYEAADDSFMVYPLYDGALNGVSGKYHIDPVYFGLTPEDAAEYDKKFPPKPLHIPESINLVLNQLKPDAQKAIKELKLATLHALTTKSEREIRSLDGIDDEAVETIKSVMHKHGKHWGSAK